MRDQTVLRQFTQQASHASDQQLLDGSRVAVIGGGPAGSFFAYFLLLIAERAGTRLIVDIYEPRNFDAPGPTGCNMCGGVISESLVQVLAMEGISLPSALVRRGIDSYKLHMEMGSVSIGTPQYEQRIGTVYRGTGPRETTVIQGDSFDRFLLNLAVERGASVIRERVSDILWSDDGRPEVKTRTSSLLSYDLVAVATGVNTALLKSIEAHGLAYHAPAATSTIIREYRLCADLVEQHLGSSLQVFLLDIPHLKFAMMIPKADYVTLCLLGESIDTEMLQSVLESPAVRASMPPGWDPELVACQCSPRMNIGSAVHPYGDRIVFIGDCGVNRLYKDGIGGAYRAAKAAASTAIFEGVSAVDFERGYSPFVKRMEFDNRVGKLLFWVVANLIQKRAFMRRAVLSMIRYEQQQDVHFQRMSTILWDLFTGSAPYSAVLRRLLHPAFMLRYFWEMAAALKPEPAHPSIRFKI